MSLVGQLTQQLSDLQEQIAKSFPLPSGVTTAAVTNIEATSATSGGTVGTGDAVAVTKRGICWSTTQNPTIQGNHKAAAEAGAGQFTVDFGGLTANTTYYVRAYATTSPATNLTQTSATLNGTVSNPDNVAVTARGFEWKATTGGTYTAVNATGETTTYSLTGLTANTSYTYRAFVTTASGTRYGDEETFTTASAPVFTCGTSTVKDYDGHTYNTVQIGNQCWMKENMRTKHYADGTSVPAGGSNTSSTAPYYYNYSSSSISLGQRGYLYNWSAAMRGAASSAASPSGVQGICPNGWHVPINAEWTTMTNYVNSQSTYRCGGTSDNIAKALASTEWWETATGNCMVGNTPANNNETGFSAVPAGHYVGLSGSPFNNERYHALFWSTTQSDSSKAYYRNLRSNNAKVVSGSFDKYRGFSVRCLRD